MRVNEYTLHDVQVVKIEHKITESGQSWIILTVQHKDKVESEITFWAARDQNINIEFGRE